MSQDAGPDGGGTDILTAKGLQAVALKSFAGAGSAFDGTMTMPSRDELMAYSQKKKTSTTEEELAEGADDEEDAENENATKEKDKAEPANGDNQKAKPEKPEWLEPTRVNKAKRDHEKKVTGARQHLEDVLKKANALIKEYAIVPAKVAVAETLKNEIEVPKTRALWISCILNDGEHLREMIREALEPPAGVGEPPTGDSASDAASSKDLRVLSRCGPCPGWEQLVHISVLEEHTAKIGEASTSAELADLKDAKASVFRLYNVIVQSCKTGIADLNSAQLSLDAELKEAMTNTAKSNEADKAAKKRKAADGRAPQGARKKLQQDGPAALSFAVADAADGAENLYGRCGDAEKQFDFAQPFVLSGEAWGANWRSEIQELKEADDCFVKIFSTSSERANDGRASMRLPEEAARAVQGKVKALFRKDFVLDAAAQAGAADVPHDALSKALAVQLFGCAGGTVSSGRFEISELACLRIGFIISFVLYSPNY